MSKKKKKNSLVRVTSVVLSAALLLTGGGFDGLSMAKAEEDEEAYFYKEYAIHTGPQDDAPLVTRGELSTTMSSPYSGEASIRNVYMTLSYDPDVNGGQVSFAGYKNKQRYTTDSFRSRDFGAKNYSAVHLEKEPGVYATELTVEASNGKIATIKDTDDDGFFNPWESGIQLHDQGIIGGLDQFPVDRVYVSRWSTDIGSVKLNTNGGDCDKPSVCVDYGQAIEGLPTASRKGYDFAGWYKKQKAMKANGVVTAANASDRVVDGDIFDGKYKDLYAGWQPHKYGVKFDANGGSGQMSTQTVEYGTKATLTKNVFHRTGYTFAGWNTARDGSGDAYGDGHAIENATAEAGGSVTLYAQWRGKSFTVAYDPNGGAGVTVPTTVRYKEGGKLAVNGYSRTGYSFTGWNKSPNGDYDSPDYKAGQEISGWDSQAGTTLYAAWKPHTYIVRFDANGGTGSLQDQEMSYGIGQTLRSASALSRSGYAFDGWSVKKTYLEDGKADYTDRQVVSGLTTEQDGIVTLYARWRASRVNIAYDPNGGSIAEGHVSSEATQKAEVGAAGTTVKKGDFFTRRGYRLTGWTTEKNGGGDFYSISKGDKYKDSLAEDGASVTLYAYWTPVTYSITQVMDTATETMSCTYDTSYILKSSRYGSFADFQHSGETFLGWSVKEGSASVDYLDGASVKNLTETAGENVKLYAVWQKNPSYIKCVYRFEDEKGNYVDDNREGLLVGKEGSVVDTSAGKLSGTAIPDGWEFASCEAFSDTAENSGIQLEDVTFKANNSSSGASEQHLIYKYRRKGYKLYLDCGTGIDHYNAAGVKKDEDGKSYVLVKYGKNQSLSVTAKTGYVLDDTALDDAGGTFNSLVEKTAGTTAGFKLTGMERHDITIRLQARPVKYGISFNLNTNGIGNPVSWGDMAKAENLSYGTEYEDLLKCNWGVQGYEFAGWNTQADGKGKSYTENSKVADLTEKDGETVVLYAQWTLRQNKMSFYKQAGDVGMSDYAYAVRGGDVYRHKNGDEKLTYLSIPVKQGYIFGGYYTAPGGTGVQVVGADGQIYNNLTGDLISDQSFYAKWTPVHYKISFTENFGEASSNMDAIDMNYDEDVTLPPNVFERKGFDFKCWNTEADGSGKDIQDAATVSNLTTFNNDNYVLYAMWKPHHYTIRFNGNGIGKGSMDEYEMYVSYGKQYGLSPNAFRSEYPDMVFKGWNTDPNLDYAIYGNEATVANLTPYDDDVITLYAIWGYDDNAKYAVRTWKQKLSSVHEVEKAVEEGKKTEYGFDWGTVYNQKNYEVADAQVLSSREASFTIPEYAGFRAACQTEPVMADGVIYYDFFYDRNRYSLEAKAGDSNVTVATGSGIYYYEEEVNLNASVQEGKYFGGWDVESGNLSLSGTAKYTPSLTFKMPASNVVIKAMSSEAEIPVPSDEPKPSKAPSGTDKNIGDLDIGESGVEISADNKYNLIPDGVKLIESSSTNPNVAYVDENGNLILGKEGTAVITLVTSAGTFLYTIHMEGIDGVLVPGNVSEKYVRSVIYYIKNGGVITVPGTERIPVISGGGTIGKSTSTNPKVAYVGEDGYLVFGEDGETIITTETSEGTIVYKVVIKDGKVTIQSWKEENAGGASPAPGNSGSPAAGQSPEPGQTQAPAPTGAQGQPAAPSKTAPSKTAAPKKKVLSMTTGGVTYKIVKGKAQVVKAKTSLKKADIKASVKIGGKKYKVVAVAQNAFKNCKKLTRITFKGTEVTIGKNAFSGCKKLKNVSAVKATKLKISKGAFKGCGKITFRFAKKSAKKFAKTVKKAGVKKYSVK